ncbi:MAG: homogentisate 1,2-dioxygenase [Bacteroidetes bacterium]|nr:homogentisate 1,2-dioxygenase [Bacteroidota bacterium]|tara:strand:- start:362 stop:1519 length:1158 start_codon:yes stop_codon:yes gene_type:complete
MPHYQIRGEVPKKRHIVFEKPNGDLYSEEVVSAEGFSDIYSIVYHNHAPTKVLKIDKPLDVIPEIAVSNNLQNRSFNGFSIQPEDDYLKSRRIVLTNDDVNLILAAPKKSMIEYFFKNAQSDEMIFIHQGSGILKTVYGELEYKEGDHLIIPRGTNYQFAFENTINRMFIVESKQPLRFPRRYMNKSGQLLEHSPYYERDIRSPQNLITNDSTGDFLIKIKRDDMIFPYHYQTHPFDAIGWDGYLYPFAISIHDFEPITGRIHQPPPVHQTFETSAMVTCAFVPRLYDYHPKAIPAPYNHSNIDSDEVLYYVDGDFMSRNNIEQGQITLHPMGIPHGPHPGAVNRSIGQKETQEYAIMVDTFKPLKLTTAALEIEDPDYYKSWLQ